MTQQARSVTIVTAKRTAIGSFGGSFATTPAHVLGAAVITDVLKHAGIEAGQVDELIFGQVLTAGCGQNPARQAAMLAGLTEQTPSMTINKVCGSGLKSVQLGAQAILCGDADIVVAGGQENMSLAPHLLPKSRTGTRMGDWHMLDSMIIDGLMDAFESIHMGITAENIAEQFSISREQQDEFALASQHKAQAAIANGVFRDEIIPIMIPQRRGEPICVDQDEFPRSNLSAADLQKLRPAFKQDGTVTAGNASGLNDGAAAVLLMSTERAEALGITDPLARITAWASAGVKPEIMGTGPIPASRNCLKKANWELAELDLIESNEAFAAQAISVNQTMDWDTNKVNVNGGAIALGHPIGASGCRILVTLLHEMHKRGSKKGLATLCIGGGQGTALCVERP